jgi:hypothetical protein
MPNGRIFTNRRKAKHHEDTMPITGFPMDLFNQYGTGSMPKEVGDVVER